MSSVTTEGHQEEAVQEGLADRRLSMTARSEWIERRMEVPLVLASLLVIPVIFVGELYPVHPLDYLATVMNWAIWSVFALEVILMLATVPDRKAWLKHHPLELAVVVLTPPFLPPVLQSARLFRLVRLVRLVVSLKHLRRAFTLDGLKYATVVGVFVLLGGGAAFTAVEHGQGLTAWDGMWWAFTTVTTVSYGDVIPKTPEGKMVALVMIAFGVCYIAMLTGAAAQMFMGAMVHKKAEHLGARDDVLLARIEALHARLDGLEGVVKRSEPDEHRLK